MCILNKDKEFNMMKKVAAVLLCTVLGSTLYARDDISRSKPFLGLEIGYSDVQGAVWTDYDAGLYDALYSSSDISYGVRLGAQNESYRTTLIFNYYTNGDYDQTVQQGILSLDYFVMSSDLSGGMAIKPFIGINGGYARYESTLVDHSDFIYGGQAGIIFSVAEKIDLDLSYRYQLTWGDEFENPLDHVGSFVFGFNYLY